MARLNGAPLEIAGTDLNMLAESVVFQIRHERELILELTEVEANGLRAERESFAPRLIGALWTAVEVWHSHLLDGKVLEYDPTQRMLMSHPKQLF